MTEQVSYTKIKSHRNGARLWIEGVKLDSAGFKGCVGAARVRAVYSPLY